MAGNSRPGPRTPPERYAAADEPGPPDRVDPARRLTPNAEVPWSVHCLRASVRIPPARAGDVPRAPADPAPRRLEPATPSRSSRRRPGSARPPCSPLAGLPSAADGRRLGVAGQPRQRPGLVLDVRRGRDRALPPTPSRRRLPSWPRRPRRPPWWRRCSTISTGSRTTSCSCSTTTTSSRRPRCTTGMAFAARAPAAAAAPGASPPGPTRRCRWPGCGRAVELVEVRAADLRFTAEEAAAYLNGPMGLRSERARRRGAGRAHRGLDRRAAAGRAVDAGSRRRQRVHRRVRRRRPLHRRLPGRGGARAGSPRDVRDFLLETSILERLTGPLCDAVTGRTGGKATLVALERANLFLVPLDDRRRWYRYHHLFADVLRAHLLDERPDAVAGAAPPGQRAGSTTNGDTLSAISHALAGGDIGRAADLMELAMPEHAPGTARSRVCATGCARCPTTSCGRGRCSPSPSSARWPRASQFDTVGRAAGRGRGVRACRRASRGRRAPRRTGRRRPSEGYRALPAAIDDVPGRAGAGGGDLDGTVAHARQALALAPRRTTT